MSHWLLVDLEGRHRVEDQRLKLIGFVETRRLMSAGFAEAQRLKLIDFAGDDGVVGLAFCPRGRNAIIYEWTKSRKEG